VAGGDVVCSVVVAVLGAVVVAAAVLAVLVCRVIGVKVPVSPGADDDRVISYASAPPASPSTSSAATTSGARLRADTAPAATGSTCVGSSESVAVAAVSPAPP